METNNSDQYNQIKHKSKNNIIVFYKFFRNSKLLYLHAFLNDQDKNKKDFKDLVILNENDVLKLSYRSYPDFILYDEDTWLEIQKETEGNLALSTEEAKILNSIIHNSFDEPLFPLFINGRAGSGKSTLLYYIFSYILLNHILQEKKLNNPPIFLTYSPKLLETAINSIKKIIKTNVRLRHSLKDNEVKSVEKYINSDLFEKSFITFREFQKGLLDKRLIEKFQDINYYRFSNFKEDWMRYCKTNPIKFIRGISSEFAWYVIRTFIKGMRSNAEEYLEPDEYDLLPRELKTIDLETYEKIYKNVFLSWYKKHLEDNDYWDDQDLTRAVLTKLENNSFEYPAVFCDEAQDFSNIELELISELSLFSKRKLEFRDIKRVPLAFAGDPLQTINPTGFNWETIKANFYEKIQSDYGRISKAQINYKELNNNYRSSKGIIIFNNTIQLLRVLLFNLKNITPQEAWFQSEFIINPTLKIDDLSILEEALRDSAKLKTIIIPCEEDQEKEYILNRDSFLKQRAIINGEVSQNIWSPMNVKGLEYNTVIIYNFGEYLCNSISINLRELVENLINNSNFSIDLSKSKKIELEYFLNKLYVATSRAKKCLIIVDTQQGYDFLWSIFDNYSKQLVESYSNLFNDNIDWDIDNNISEFQFSTEVVNTEDDNPEYLAYSYYKDGLSSYNPRKLRSAAEYFRFCQKHTEANRSLAKAYEFENNFIRAAEYYEKIQEGDEATKCYWRTNDPDKYQKIVSVFSKIPLNPNNIFYLASKFLLTENKKEESILCLRDFYKLIKISERNDFYIISHNNWKPFYNSLLSSLKDYSLEFPNLNDWDDVIDILKKLGELGVQIKKQRDYIELLFNLKQYNDVINELKENNDTENDLFIKANALSITYPGNLEYYFKLKDYNQINSLYLLNKNKLESLKFYELEIILKSLIESQDLNSLKVFLSNHFDQISDLFGESLLERVLLIAFEKRFYAIGFDIIQKLRHRKEDEFFANIIKSVFHLNDVRIITYFVCLFLSQEITFNRFHTVVDILERKRAIFDFIPDELINKPSLEKVLLFFLAKKTDFKASKEPRERIQSYVKNLLVEDNRWRNLCSLQVASAAIERLEYHINSREFYEKIIKSNLFNDIDVYYAKKRWLKVKMKQSLTMK
ncbi:MAG: hypothetical protein NZM09_11355, partial [Ignavibacterium sp.]|nr:hypothetical protein [Ignavibacterium sp.]MDW8376274.1 hypothetical protein [Ignavibacteriales bacterium]